MGNIFRGESVSRDIFLSGIDKMKNIIGEDLLLRPLLPEEIIAAVGKMTETADKKEILGKMIALGIPEWAADDYLREAIGTFNADALREKVRIELGDGFFEWKNAGAGIEEKGQPIGAIFHIGAGNVLGLSAFSVVEGLLAGNINILKLPEDDGDISTELLLRLIEIEPRLKPYIYVTDISSKEHETIRALAEFADAIVVWGSDEAIGAVRKLAPPSVPIIEWGHRLSFAYFTKNENEERNLQNLADEICKTDQLYCSSPQCVFYETGNLGELDDFAGRLAKQLERAVQSRPAQGRPLDVQAAITWSRELVKAEEALGETKYLSDAGGAFGVMVRYRPELRASPLFRNIWVMPVARADLMELLRARKGYLQTVGLSCGENPAEFDELCGIFYAAGVNRVASCGKMSESYAGEPHDGMFALRRYARIINRRKP
jgi:hypothetical protein